MKFTLNNPQTLEGFWLGLQADYDLEEQRKEIASQLQRIHLLGLMQKATLRSTWGHSL